MLKRLLIFSTMVIASSASAAVPIPMELFREARSRQLQNSIRTEHNSSVAKWIRFFSVTDRERFDRFMQRGSLYKTLIQDILVEQGVPPEMYYLAMIESGFARRARSHASAVGVWQFIAPTARQYGLRVDKHVDERLDVIRSTRAAARFLKALHREFGSWHLAMAAYNSGEGRVRSAIRRGRTRDFWRLARGGYLPSETANYIPKFQAAMKIGRNPEQYGFKRKTIYEFPVVRRVRVGGQLHLAEVARRHRMPASMLASFNPHLLTGKTPRRGYEVWVPSIR